MNGATNPSPPDPVRPNILCREIRVTLVSYVRRMACRSRTSLCFAYHPPLLCSCAQCRHLCTLVFMLCHASVNSLITPYQFWEEQLIGGSIDSFLWASFSWIKLIETNTPLEEALDELQQLDYAFLEVFSHLQRVVASWWIPSIIEDNPTSWALIVPTVRGGAKQDSGLQLTQPKRSQISHQYLDCS